MWARCGKLRLYIVGWNGLAMDSLDADSLYFGAADGKLYNSADGGESWQKTPHRVVQRGKNSHDCMRALMRVAREQWSTSF